MKVIEKLNFDRNILEKKFGEWCKTQDNRHIEPWYPEVYTDKDSLYHTLETEGYTNFLDWAFSEYVELEEGYFTPNGAVVVKSSTDDPMIVRAFSVFSTGWQYCYDMLVKHKKDPSRPFAGLDEDMFRQDFGIEWDDENTEELIIRIDDKLEDHDRLRTPDGWHNALVKQAPRIFEFYDAYDEMLKKVKEAVLNGTHRIDSEYVRSVCRI